MLRHFTTCAAFLVAAVSLADQNTATLGTSFRVVFTRNFELSSTNCNLSLTIVNPNNVTAKANIWYYTELYNYNNVSNQYYNVDANGFLEVSFPHFDAWEYMNTGLQEQFDTRIVVTTNYNVTLIANNYHKSGYGDSYLVLPYNFAGTSYSLSLPAPAPLQNGVMQYTVLYFVPIDADVNLTVTVNGMSRNKVAKFGLGTPLSYYAVSYNANQKDPLFFVTGDKPFLIVAGVSCLPSTNKKACDYAAFMPTPVADTSCAFPGPFSDYHPTDLVNAQRFGLAMPSQNCGAEDVLAFNDGLNVSLRADGSVQTIPPTTGDRVVLSSTESYIQPIRLGGVSDSDGSFLTIVPSIQQFATGTINFITRTSIAYLYIITDSTASLTMRLDANIVVQFSPEIIRINGSQYHFTSVQVNSTSPPALHTLDASPGKFVFYVTGSLQAGHRYGYYPAYNQATS